MRRALLPAFGIHGVLPMQDRIAHVGQALNTLARSRSFVVQPVGYGHLRVVRGGVTLFDVHVDWAGKAHVTRVEGTAEGARLLAKYLAA